MRKAELKERKLDAVATKKALADKRQAAALNSTKPEKTQRANRFLDRAFDVTRKLPEFDQVRRDYSVKARRDSAVQVQAKYEGREVRHRTFRSNAAAREYLLKYKKKKSTVSWFGVSDRSERNGLFYYQSPVGSVASTGRELATSATPATPADRKTDLRLKQAMKSPDVRVTVYTLEVVSGWPPSTRKKVPGAKAKRIRIQTRSGKRSKRGKNGSRKAGKSSGGRGRSDAGTVRRAGVVRKPKKVGKADTRKSAGKSARGTATKRRRTNRKG